MRIPPRLFNCILGEDECIVLENVIGVERADGCGCNALNVAGGADNGITHVGSDDESLFNLEVRKNLYHCAGLLLGKLDGIENDELLVCNLCGKSGLKCNPLELLVEAHAIVAGLGSEYNAAVRPLGGSG